MMMIDMPPGQRPAVSSKPAVEVPHDHVRPKQGISRSRVLSAAYASGLEPPRWARVLRVALAGRAAAKPSSPQPRSPYTPVTMASLQDDQPATIAFCLILGYLALGTAFYSTTTDWGILGALYFVVGTATSSGYGDLEPLSSGARLFTAGYILLGVGCVGTALGEVVSSLLKVDLTPAGRIAKWLSGLAASDEPAAADGSGSDLGRLVGGGDAASRLAGTLATVAATLAFGSAAICLLDPTVAPADALYFAVTTASSVSYGHWTPTSEAGEAFVSLYALVGTCVLARSLGALATLPLERRRQQQQEVVLEQYGAELEAHELADLTSTLCSLELCTGDRDYCTPSDFALAMLVRQDKCSEADVKAALQTFGRLDIDGSGDLSPADVEAWREERARREARQ